MNTRFLGLLGVMGFMALAPVTGWAQGDDGDAADEGAGGFHYLDRDLDLLEDLEWYVDCKGCFTSRGYHWLCEKPIAKVQALKVVMDRMWFKAFQDDRINDVGLEAWLMINKNQFPVL